MGKVGVSVGKPDSIGRRSGEALPLCLLCNGRMAARHEFGEYRLAYCDHCGLGRLHPMPSPEILGRLYGSQGYFEGTDRVGYADYRENAELFASTFRRKLELLLRSGPVGVLLEIGCGPGLLLEEARKIGIASAVGVDLNPWAIEQARARGLEAAVGSIDSVAAEPRFDAAVMLDVLEHVTDPLAFLNAVHARLRPGGRLLVMTPNIRSWLAWISGPRWVSFKIPEHVFYYSPRSIGALLDRCGFVPVSVHGTGQYATVDFFLDRLRRIAPGLAIAAGPVASALGLRARTIFIPNGSIDVVARVR